MSAFGPQFDAAQSFHDARSDNSPWYDDVDEQLLYARPCNCGGHAVYAKRKGIGRWDDDAYALSCSKCSRVVFGDLSKAVPTWNEQILAEEKENQE